ncbi:deoxyguanosinetriphosphate triphosphohydrolase [Chakrabartia godavariana]|nr:deoxyguanosinetriphosphate triphosphohydrolase [Chakrabartia godavariana]
MTVRAPYACDPAQSRGRRHAEPTGSIRGPRSEFQRDRDRIIHSISFRRLRHKTQVFVAPDGDHFRVRLTHSIEVAQIGRTIARALGLDEDLTEALCLAHDLGHPPFGHAGERGLEQAMVASGGFDHNGHALRILTRLERSYPSWPGLNLTWETLEGLAKHNGPVFEPGWAMRDVDGDFPLGLRQRASLEAQVAAIADDIAYDNHDIDDGLRAGLLDFDQVIAAPMVVDGWASVKARFPQADQRLLAAELVRSQIGAMVNDVIAETQRRIAASGIETVDDVRAANGALVAFSPAMATSEADLKRFMYANLYHHPHQLEIAETCGGIVTQLFAAYHADRGLMPQEWRADCPDAQPGIDRHICDFIAGMTDRYAIARYLDLIGPVDLPDGF